MAKKKAAAANVEPLYVKSKIREYLKSKDCNTSSSVIDGDKLNARIIEILDRAIDRAKKNGKKTVKPRDI
jgi:histone H3/H4